MKTIKREDKIYTAYVYEKQLWHDPVEIKNHLSGKE